MEHLEIEISFSHEDGKSNHQKWLENISSHPNLDLISLTLIPEQTLC